MAFFGLSLEVPREFLRPLTPALGRPAPLAAALVREPIAQAFWGAPGTEFAHGHTFAGNPVSCAAGLASIREIVERRLPENARRVGAYLVQKLEALRPLCWCQQRLQR